MLQIAYIREHQEEVVKRLTKKRLPQAAEKVAAVLAVDEARRQAQTERDSLFAESNRLSKAIGQFMKSGQQAEAEQAKQQSASLKADSKALDERVRELEQELTQLLYQLPNLPHELVPEGAGADDNEVVLQRGEIPQLQGDALPHWELVKKYDIIDFDLGNKVSGAGFPFYKGKGARLQRAMVNFFLDQAQAQGYTEIQPPILINEDSGYGTGQLPDKEGQMYFSSADGLYLIPTAEVPITNMFRDAILEEKDLPQKLVGYTPCFRREAGSWGAHVRGLNRLHQFDKVEIVQIQHPDRSYEALDQMCAYVESLLEQLELPFRKLRLCGGDISFNAALCYDMETYSAAQGRWLEVSSVSNFETFQANRMKLRFRAAADGKAQLAHTLNGSALALPRIVATILENNQTPEGIRIPKVLQPYCGFDRID
jgi:seryl-tRNA synthetase